MAYLNQIKMGVIEINPLDAKNQSGSNFSQSSLVGTVSAAESGCRCHRPPHPSGLFQKRRLLPSYSVGLSQNPSRFGTFAKKEEISLSTSTRIKCFLLIRQKGPFRPDDEAAVVVASQSQLAATRRFSVVHLRTTFESPRHLYAGTARASSQAVRILPTHTRQAGSSPPH
jgi:hypothetical protein